jgi:hypothetical protein
MLRHRATAAVGPNSRAAPPRTPTGTRKDALAGMPFSVEVPGNLGAVEQRRKLHSVGTPCYGQSGHGRYVSVVLTPGGCRLAGVTLVTRDIDCSSGV